jgi:aspartyl-tRNA(Asn)/glutamyl-tRNA(Gln) amidotransferase subunit B
MEKGVIRFEANVSIRPRGVTELGTRVEIKNLNSFRALERTVEYEIARQYEQWQGDPESCVIGKMGKSNRGYDDVRGVTVFQREKEESHDYRYFPDPDLVPVRVDAAWRDSLAATIGELPLARRRRYIEQHGLTFKEADALTQDAPTGDLLDAAVGQGAEAKRCVNLLLGRGSALANERNCSIAEVGVSAGQLAELAKMLAGGQINATAAAKVFDLMVAGGLPPAQVAQAEGLLAVTDSSAIERWVQEAIEANPKAAEDIRSGGKNRQKAFGFLMGQVMRRSGGAAQPAEVQRLLAEKFGG